MPESIRESSASAIRRTDDLWKAFEHASTGLAVLDFELHCEWANAAFCQMVGYREDELLGGSLDKLTPAFDWEAEAALLDRLRRGDIRSYHLEKRWTLKSGDLVWALTCLSASREPNSDHSRILCQTLPILEFKNTHAMLMESERLGAMGQMASGIAHESRNALQQIGACAEMLAMELEKSAEALDLVRGVQEAEARLLSLFEDVRAYAIRLQLERRQLDAAQVWRHAWAALEAVHPNRSLRLVEHLDTADLLVSLSPNYAEQLFFKIFENSIDACEGPVTIDVRCEGSELEGRAALKISIQDSGPGFTPETLARALEPFFGSKTQGTGLGLPIAKRIVEAHGGQLRIANESGALVDILLPREA